MSVLEENAQEVERPDEQEVAKCPGCGCLFERPKEYPPESWGYYVCPTCRVRYPESLLKACIDPFDYACGLRTGEVIVFQTAHLRGEYVTLTIYPTESEPFRPHAIHRRLPYPCPRGVDVRVADIVWCADAPWGS
jgi:hypothetical protein